MVTKVRICIRIIYFDLLLLVLKIVQDVFLKGNGYYRWFSELILAMRGWWIQSFQALVLEILYLDVVPNLLRRCKRKRANRHEVNTVTGSFGLTTKNAKYNKGGDEDGAFELENPMRESQHNVPNPAL